MVASQKQRSLPYRMGTTTVPYDQGRGVKIVCAHFDGV